LNYQPNERFQVNCKIHWNSARIEYGSPGASSPLQLKIHCCTQNKRQKQHVTSSTDYLIGET